ncbi:MAG TPA: HAMP domain-containing sensor histidine kinase [Opitutales bacterium]|nr:HAMP domain-containing sensor histidine kinase [Opitutales bacterium]
MKRHLVIYYWLLLLVSTLAIGGLAFYLLQRESDRLLENARHQAVSTGQNIAANLTAMLSNKKSETMGMLASLPDEPDDRLDKFLLGWKESNLIVQDVILYRPGNGLALPLSHTTEQMELEPLLHDGKDWLWPDSQQPALNLTITSQLASPIKAPQMEGNSTAAITPPKSVANRDVLDNSIEVANVTDTPNIGINLGGVSLTYVGNATSTNLSLQQTTSSQATDSSGLELRPTLPDGQSQTISITKIVALPPDIIITPISNRNMSFEVVATNADAPANPEQHWVLLKGKEDYDRRWLGWMRSKAGGAVRGVVLSWAELEKSMLNCFPKALDPTVGYVLLDQKGNRVVSVFPDSPSTAPVGGVPVPDDPAAYPAFKALPTPGISLALASELPGWTLQVYFNPAANFTSGYFALSTVMVAILVMSVLIGGTLLMREARREASEAARKTNFVSNVSHELKTPLTTIRMYAELLGEGRVRDQAKQASYLTTIISESQRLTRLVNNVLDFSRLEQGRKQYNPSDVVVASVIESVIESQKPRLDEAGFSIGSSFPAGPDVRVYADRDALEQVLINLIDNAMKYAASGRQIDIRVAVDSQFALVSVNDRGPGVPPAHRERIFEMFHRVDDSITASQPGAGLGLSIARRLMRDQEGDLYYQDNTPRGSSFIAKLPLATEISAAKIT